MDIQSQIKITILILTYICVLIIFMHSFKYWQFNLLNVVLGIGNRYQKCTYKKYMQSLPSFLYQNLTDSMLYTSLRSIRSQASLMLHRSSVCEQWLISWLIFSSTARDASKFSYVELLVANVNLFWTSCSIKIKKIWT